MKLLLYLCLLLQLRAKLKNVQILLDSKNEVDVLYNVSNVLIEYSSSLEIVLRNKYTFNHGKQYYTKPLVLKNVRFLSIFLI